VVNGDEAFHHDKDCSTYFFLKGSSVHTATLPQTTQQPQTTLPPTTVLRTTTTFSSSNPYSTPDRYGNGNTYPADQSGGYAGVSDDYYGGIRIKSVAESDAEVAARLAAMHWTTSQPLVPAGVGTSSVVNVPVQYTSFPSPPLIGGPATAVGGGTVWETTLFRYAESKSC